MTIASKTVVQKPAVNTYIFIISSCSCELPSNEAPLSPLKLYIAKLCVKINLTEFLPSGICLKKRITTTFE